MREIDAETAADYLREARRVPEVRAVRVRPLGGGVSNVVLRVDVDGQEPFVLKQSRERLRTEAHWVSRLDRIWTEQAALELLATVLPEGAVPAVLFADRPNYLFAMSCAPEVSTTWKERLLAGEADPRLAARAGTILATMHADLAGHPALAGLLADTSLFDGLRIDPYYRTIARVHPDLRPQIEALIDSMAEAPERTFAHADFSPKNILVHPGGLTVVDFETAHAGDPAFDLGFFLSHLLLKAARAAPAGEPYFELTRAFWSAYLDRAGLAGDGSSLMARAIRHAAACCLARVDGKSPVDYLDEPRRHAVRQFARGVIGRDAPADWDALLATVAREVLDKPPASGS
jgi:5-methylthioribose kinase